MNRPLVARMVGVSYGHALDTAPARRMLEAAVDELGFELGGLDSAVSEDLSTGRPWREPLTPVDLVRERRMLQAACYVVCAYLSGMRDSEVQELRRGCHEVAAARTVSSSDTNCGAGHSRVRARRAARRHGW
ncbi:MAG: hypothetical protein M3314_10940 [Actinomycetota bacterium]|nr:hypothetical protein [Actinomycetota bacterium]